MIGRLRGEIAIKQAPHLLLDVNGVGYEIEAPMSTFFKLPESGQQTTLYTHLAVRDDAHVLYGFATESERAMFRSLLKVNGVGAKMALGILSGMSAEAFAQCVEAEDVASLVRLPGIGKKTAQRLIVEMRDRLGDMLGGSAPAVAGVMESGRPQTPVSDAVAALVSLGYKAPDASRMVKAVAQPGMASEALIRAALQNTAHKG
ncbi:Holliday junction branch migration protein RuvA [Candidatus Endoriftia persephonae]|jgi:Holliday junction DNA helicase RuvA|uniref:Holliday junction branch migration complex subunit RuvA n=2 Tax=Gammaproteobacteria TaxID=1236 RepID=G2FIM0_9GAMM|nr:Holliday junction branch migration protein RuvA [Candidatus Endoriftia persephone]EGW53332.1 Holliday junction ATP-dependent DNA helicase RuvA [endosymbiont of Tevnia jerichonana (vent Tica)]USF86524.1 Holliday junction branch migration protein RuvA [Candidatus Endoriftia persephone]